jgi:hypothetical protein
VTAPQWAPLQEEAQQGRRSTGFALMLGATVLALLIVAIASRLSGAPEPNPQPTGARVTGLGISAVVPEGWQDKNTAGPEAGILLREEPDPAPPEGARYRVLLAVEPTRVLVEGGEAWSAAEGIGYGPLGRWLADTEWLTTESVTPVRIEDQATATYEVRLGDLAAAEERQLIVETTGDGVEIRPAESWLLTPIIVNRQNILLAMNLTPDVGEVMAGKSLAAAKADYRTFVESVVTITDQTPTASSTIDEARGRHSALGLSVGVPAGWQVAGDPDSDRGLLLTAVTARASDPNRPPAYLSVYGVTSVWDPIAGRMRPPPRATKLPAWLSSREDLAIDAIEPVTVGGRSTVTVRFHHRGRAQYGFGGDDGVAIADTTLPVSPTVARWGLDPASVVLPDANRHSCRVVDTRSSPHCSSTIAW